MEAYYMGYRHSQLTTESAKQGLIFGGTTAIDPLRDLRHPLNETNIETRIVWEDFRPVDRMVSSDYEDDLKQFCVTNVFPYLRDKQLVDRMEGGLWYWLARFEGEEHYNKPDNHTVHEREEYDSDNVIWTIDPVMNVTDYIFRFKANNTIEALSMLDVYKKGSLLQEY